MLTIKNIENTKRKEFSFLGNEWILFEVDVNNLEYKFIFIPMDAGRYDTQKAQLVLLNRTKHKRRGYPLWTTDGHFIYIDINDMDNWIKLVDVILENKMLCL